MGVEAAKRPGLVELIVDLSIGLDVSLSPSQFLSDSQAWRAGKVWFVSHGTFDRLMRLAGRSVEESREELAALLRLATEGEV